MKRSCLLIVCFALMLLHCPHAGWGQSARKSTRYFLSPTLPQKPAAVKSFVFVSGEQQGGKDTLFQVLSASGEPLSYYRNILREVCFDDKCRLLNVQLYWNVTGRYLGFELPKGEFLSKAEHVPFTANEYYALNNILADSLSPLGSYRYEELVPKTDYGKLRLDGVTSPTKKEVLQYVVKGAVYTTYTLWQLVYGSTRDEVMRLTQQAMTPSLVQHILASADRSDQYWILNRMEGNLPMTPALLCMLLDFVDDSTYSLAERALNVMPNTSLDLDSTQLNLLNRFRASGHSLKKLILEKLMDASNLHPAVVSGLASQLKTLNGEPLAATFRLFRKFRVTDRETLAIVKDLQRSPNSYIALMATEYLKQFAPRR